jgi:hypothetical protein
MCKLCNIEHSNSWTCEQAKANYEQWHPPVISIAPTVSAEDVSPEVTPKFDRSAKMKEWWSKRRAG